MGSWRGCGTSPHGSVLPPEDGQPSLPLVVRPVRAEQTLDLRSRVLRNHMPGVPATAPEDALPGTWHLGAFAGDRLVGVVSGFSEEAPSHPGTTAQRFRFMAVEPHHQGGGVGSALLTEVIRASRERDARLLWANGRDSVLGFYSRLGFAVEGDGFMDATSHLPHHRVVLEL